MHKSTISFLTFALVPTVAFALTIEPAALYKDVRASAPEAAGINMLSRSGIVTGYGNGFFGFTRQINRAEFLKITMKSAAEQNETFVSQDCFPDVHASDWFSPFVCAAKEIGIVSGKADTGFFDPSGTVTYGEALKMLTLVYRYEVPFVESAHWAEPFYRAAAAKQVDVPMTIDLDTPLTRAIAARLSAAFMAEANGQLSELRLAEAGQYASSSSLSVSSSSMSSSTSSVSSSISNSSSSVASAPLFTLPPVSHFLLLGQASDAIADLTLGTLSESARIVSAQVKLMTPVSSLDTLEIVTADGGTHVATLRRRITSDTVDYLQTYEVQLTGADQFSIPAGNNTSLVLRALIRSADTGGSSEQLLEVRIFSVTYYGESTHETVNVPAAAPFPKHQTAFGRITSVTRASAVSAPLVAGVDQLIGSFAVVGNALPGKTLSLKELIFSTISTGTVSVSNWSLRASGSAVSVPCSINPETKVLSCANLDAIAALPSDKPLILEVYGDIAIPSGSSGNSLEIDLSQAGSPSDFGSVRWTDQAGTFKWVEGSSPLARGTKLQ